MWTKTKLFFNKPIAKRTVYSIFVFIILAVFLVPTTFSFIAFNKGDVFAYTRDHSSGTFEAFDKKVLGNEDNSEPQKFSKNVFEVSSNDRMVSNVQANANTIGYVSLGTIGTFNDDDKFIKDSIYDDISILAYNGVSPEKKDNIALNKDDLANPNKYSPSRNFNQFFRVEKGTTEAEILKVQPTINEKNNSNYIYWTIGGASIEELNGLSNEEKISYAYYQWILHSPAAEKIIETDGEISIGEEKWSDDETIKAEKELMQILYGEVDLKEFDGFDKKVKIVQVGSTSVQAIITDFETKLSPIANEYNVYLSHVQNGSGDASKVNPPAGTSAAPYIGFQSREPQSDGKTFEYSTWGYSSLEELEKSNAYNPLAIDAIAIIANNDGLTIKDDQNNNVVINNITEKIIRQIYYEGNLSWQDLYVKESGLVL